MRPIGCIRTPYPDQESAPIQGRFAPERTARVELLPELAEGLKDIESFSHLWLLYRFDRAGEVKLVRSTFLDDLPHGVFASRHPGRPNGLGMTVVELVERQGATLVVKGADMLDGTPLLDIKPYLPQFDAYPRASRGWTEGKEHRPKPPGRE